MAGMAGMAGMVNTADTADTAVMGELPPLSSGFSHRLLWAIARFWIR